MNGAIAYRPLIRPSSPSRLSFSPVAGVRFPPSLSPATITWPASIASRAALAMTHFRPDTQSFRPAGNGATSGTEDGTTALRKSTMTTATPLAAISLPQPWNIASKQDRYPIPPPWM